MKFDLSYLDCDSKYAWESIFGRLDAKYGSVSYCTWDVINPLFSTVRKDFRHLAVRKILAILKRVSRNSIISRNHMYHIVNICLCSNKRIGWAHANVKYYIKQDLFYIEGVLYGAGCGGMINGEPIAKKYSDAYLWAKFWNDVEEIQLSKKKNLSPNEIEMGVLLTTLGDTNAIKHYRSQNFWRRKEFNFGNNHAYSGRRP